MVSTPKEILIFYGRGQNTHGGLRSTRTSRVRAVVIRSGERQTGAVFFPTKLRSRIPRRRRGFYIPHDRLIYKRRGRAADHLAAKTVLTCLQMQSALCLMDNEVYV